MKRAARSFQFCGTYRIGNEQAPVAALAALRLCLKTNLTHSGKAAKAAEPCVPSLADVGTIKLMRASSRLLLLLVFAPCLLPAFACFFACALHLTAQLLCRVFGFLCRFVRAAARLTHALIRLLIAFPLTLLRRRPLACRNSYNECQYDCDSHASPYQVDGL